KKSTPASTADERISKAVLSSTLPQSVPPSCQQPRLISETRIPVLPNARVFICRGECASPCPEACALARFEASERLAQHSSLISEQGRFNSVQYLWRVSTRLR